MSVRAPSGAPRLIVALLALLVASATWAMLGSATHTTAPPASPHAISSDQGTSPLAASSPPALRRHARSEQRAFWVRQRATGAVTLRNPLQQLQAQLDKGRLSVHATGGLSLALGSPSLARPGAPSVTPRFAATVLERNRATLSGAGLSEWFTNGPQGLEQGFTLARRPPGRGPLSISQELSGNATAHLGAGGQSVTFTSSRGVLRYQDLVVTDATGRPIPARLSISNHRLTISVNDEHAVYPLRIDPTLTSTYSTPASSTIVYGESNTDTLTVVGDPSDGTPTGNVSFYWCGPTGLSAPASSCNSTANPVGAGTVALTGSPDTATATSAPFTPPSVGTYCFYAVYNTGGNYDSASDGSSEECFTVDPAPLQITASSPSTTYGTVPAITVASYASFVNGDTAASLTDQPVCFSADTSSTPAGSSPSSTCTGASDPNYSITYVNGSVSVGAAPLQITASSPSITYGQAVPTITASFSGLVNNESASVLGTVSCSVVPSSPYEAGVAYGTSCSGGASDSNYSISYVPGSLTVNKAPLVITASSPSMVYGGSVPPVTASYSGFENGDGAGDLGAGLVCSTGAASSSPAGSYTTGCSGAVDSNYSISYVNGSLTVDPAPLVITASSPSTTYGTVPVVTVASYGTFVNGDTAASLTAQPVCFTADTTSTAQGSSPSTTCTGASDPNYAITYVKGDVTIGPAPLQITASSPSITYGQAVPTITASFSGLVNNESASVLGTVSCSVVPSSPYEAGVAYGTSCSGGASDPNYSISYVPGSLTVNKAPLSVTVSGSETYGGSAGFSISGYSGFVNGDTPPLGGSLTGCTTTAGDSAGFFTGTIDDCSGLSDSNYAITYADGGFTVKPAPLTITASDAMMTYGGSLPAVTAEYSTFAHGDTSGSLSVAPTCFTTATVTSPVSSTPATICDDAVDPDYTITYVNGSTTIDPAALHAHVIGAGVYGSNSESYSVASWSGFVNGELAGGTVTGTLDCSSGVGTTAVGVFSGPSGVSDCSGLSAPNYTIVYVDGVVTISPAPLTANVVGTRVYGATVASSLYSVVSYSGLVNGDSASAITGPPSCSTSVLAGAGAGLYTGTLSGCMGLSDTNYTISYNDDGYSVTPAALQITASSPSTTYGTVPAISVAGYSGFVPGDTSASLTAQPVCYTADTSSTPAGSSPSSTCTGAVDPNYSISYVNGSVLVGKAPLQITASSASITYGAAAPAVTASYSGFENNESASALTTAPACSIATGTAPYPVGSYTTACNGAAAANYSITYLAGALTVNKAPLVITASSPSMVYGGSVPGVTASYSGFENGDGAGDLGGGLACSPGATSSSPAGSYTTSCSGAVDSNYSISYVAGSLSVKPAALVITAPSLSTTYGTAPVIVLGSGGYSGFVNGDTSASLTTQPVCLTAATSSSAVGSYTTYCTGASDPNYSITYLNGSVSVGVALLQITASSPSMSYGGSVPQVTASFSGFENNDNASVLGAGFACSVVTSGPYHVGGVYATGCSGAVDSNYSISYVAGTLTVTKAPLVITASSPSMVYGASVPSVTASYGGFENSDNAGSLTTAPTCSITTGATPYQVGTYTTACSGAVDSNYTISYVNGGLSVTPAPLVITAPSPTMTYGGPAPAVVLAPDDYSGFVNGDTSASLTAPAICFTAAVPQSPAGSSPATVCYDASDPNYTITYKSGSVTVDQEPLRITASSPTILYGGTVPAITPSYSGFVNGENPASLGTLPTCSTLATSSSPVTGSPYATTCTGAIDSNYHFNYVNGTITVNPAPLQITVTGTQVYGGTPGPTFTIPADGYSGFVNGETPSVLSGTSVDCSTQNLSPATPAGVYFGDILTTTCGVRTDPNYAITYADGGFTVTDATTSSVSALPLSSIAIGGSESDGVTVSGNVVGGPPTGTVTFSVCAVEPAGTGVTPCSAGGAQVGSPITLTAASSDTSTATSTAFTPTSGPGTYCFRAVYDADNNYHTSADGTLDECFAVTQVGAPTVSTPTSATVALGAANTDSATVTGNTAGGSPTGSVTFYACGPGTSPCSVGGTKVGTTDLLAAAGDTATATSPGFLPASGPGTYCFRAVYTGDDNYTGSIDGTGSECFTVTKGTSSTTAAPSEPTILSGAVTDDVTVHGNAGGGSPTGSVSVYVCGPGVGSCASTAAPVGGAVALAVAGANTSTAVSAAFTPSGGPGIYCFYALYGGDAHYGGSSDATSDSCFTVAVASTSTPVQTSTAAPSNAFSITSHAFKKHAIDLTLALPGPGSLTLAATHARSTTPLASRTVAVARQGSLAVKLSLDKSAKAAVAAAVTNAVKYHATVTITFTPTGGTARTLTLTILLAK